MLKTALRPHWIVALLCALLAATVFVWLSKWQFDRSTQDVSPVNPNVEVIKPLGEIFQPFTPMMQNIADQHVTVQGIFQEKKVVIPERIFQGKSGFWLVQAFQVKGATPVAVIPVVRAWFPDEGEALRYSTPSGETTVVGRLLPPEASEQSTLMLPQLKNVSTAELANIWDTRMYAGFIASDVINTKPQPPQGVNWLNIFYGIEWIIFAGFALFLWWRLVKDEYDKEHESSQ